MSRYKYACAKCGGSVTKVPCHSAKDDDGNKKDYVGLHGWKCNTCGDGVKISRTMRSVQ